MHIPSSLSLKIGLTYAVAHKVLASMPCYSVHATVRDAAFLSQDTIDIRGGLQVKDANANNECHVLHHSFAELGLPSGTLLALAICVQRLLEDIESFTDTYICITWITNRYAWGPGSHLPVTESRWQCVSPFKGKGKRGRRCRTKGGGGDVMDSSNVRSKHLHI